MEVDPLPKPNVFQEFVTLLYIAHGGSEAVDAYDLDSADFNKREKFFRLCTEQNEAFRQLVEFTAANKHEILSRLR